jgi:hypothetical protein
VVCNPEDCALGICTKKNELDIPCISMFMMSKGTMLCMRH